MERMSYADPQPPQSFNSAHFFSSDSNGFWQKPFLTVGGNEQQQQNSQFGYPHPFKEIITSSEKPPNTAAPMSTRPIPTGVRGTSHIFYKTRLCVQFRDGNCRNGDLCTFAHGTHDLRHPPSNWQELIRDRGPGNGNWGDDQTMIQRLKLCKKYFNGEECPYGEKCNFLHERPPPQTMKKPRIDTLDQRESSVISIGLNNGSGDFDQTAAFWKTKICSKWEMGICPYGERCSFAHGQSDLRSPSVPNEAAISTCLVPRKQHASSFPTALGNSANVLSNNAAAADDEDGRERTLRWKLKKKINRIYADWIENSSPLVCSPEKE